VLGSAYLPGLMEEVVLLKEEGEKVLLKEEG